MSETPHVPPPGGSFTPPPPPAGGGVTGGSRDTAMLVLSYLWFLSIIPLVAKKEDREVQWHAKNGLILALNLLLFGGVGYIIMGQKMKGYVAIVVWILGLASCGIVSGIVAIVAAIDGMMQAQQLQAGHPVGEWTFFQDHR